MLAKIDTRWSPKSWPAWITHISPFRGESPRHVVIKLIFTATVYHLWIERNLRKFQATTSTWEVVVHKIFNVVKGRLLSLPKLPEGSQNNRFIRVWGITVE